MPAAHLASAARRTLVAALTTPLVGALLAPTAAAGATHGPVQSGTRQVDYHGLRVQVPVGWPVYDLARHPATCVRFDQSALYLGTPGPDQRCPAHAAGRSDALLVQPESAAVAARARADADRGMVTLRVAPARVLLTASRASGSALITRLLRGATTASGAPAQATVVGSAPRSLPPRWTWPWNTATRPIGPTVFTGRGFDTCAAPSSTAMRTWWGGPYGAVGIYLGGVNRACGDGNLSADWVREVGAMGWRLFPIYVGYQAPCARGSRLVSIDPDQPEAQGAADAEDAAQRAASFGIRSGSAIYFDLESYQPGDLSCRQTVLSFVSAWSRRLRALGFYPGVYSGAKSGIADLASCYLNAGYAHPSAIWIARWNNDPTLSDPLVPDRYWSRHQRMKQYHGSRTETRGGIAINLDPDAMDAPVARR
jgi:hypothetical protein